MKNNSPPTQIQYKYYYFGPFLFHTRITPEECQMVVKEGNKCRQKAYDFRHELAGHLSEEYELNDKKSIGEWLKKYLESYTIAYNEWRGGTKHMQPHFQLTALWINYMKAHDFNPPHEHGADLSFVLYPDVPEELYKENKAFTGNAAGPGAISWKYGEGSRQCVNTVDIFPTTGDMFIFPASLQHWVYPFRSNVERLSVSGNILFEKDSRTSFLGDKKKDGNNPILKEEDINLNEGGGGGSNFEHSDQR